MELKSPANCIWS